MSKSNIVKNCILCSKEFKTSSSNIAKGFGKFCSYKCRTIHSNTGRKCTEITKSLISKSRIGKYIGEKNSTWKGGVIKMSGRYLVLKPNHSNARKNGYILRYRLVMSQIIGRPLFAKEVVHHIDGNYANDDPNNLMLFPTESAHARFHKMQKVVIK